MSAPHTDIDKQAERHRGPLRGMFAVVLFALVLLVVLLFWAFGRGGDPEGAQTQVQTGTGGTEERGGDGVSANDFAREERGAGTGGAADPTAVEVPSLQVQNPQTGTEDTINPLVGPSETAQPLDPVEGEPAAGAVTGTAPAESGGSEAATGESNEDAPVAIIPGEE